MFPFRDMEPKSKKFKSFPPISITFKSNEPIDEKIKHLKSVPHDCSSLQMSIGPSVNLQNGFYSLRMDHLKFLSVDGYLSIRDWISLIKATKRSMEELEIVSKQEFNSDLWNEIKSIRKLKVLKFEGFGFIQNQFQNSTFNLTKFHLKEEGYFRFCETATENLANFLQMMSPTLTELKTNSIQSLHLDLALSEMPQLKKLEFGWIIGELKQMNVENETIEFIKLNELSPITEQILGSVKNLKHLKPHKLNEEGLAWIVSNAPSLTSLSFSIWNNDLFRNANTLKHALDAYKKIKRAKRCNKNVRVELLMFENWY